jgi:hypothetical protein
MVEWECKEAVTLDGMQHLSILDTIKIVLLILMIVYSYGYIQQHQRYDSMIQAHKSPCHVCNMVK